MKCSTTEIVLNLGYDPEIEINMEIEDEEDFSEYVAPKDITVHLCGRVEFKNVYPRFSKDHHTILAWPCGIRSIE